MTFYFNGHRIDVNWSSWSGFEEVLYDGRLVSKKHSLSMKGHLDFSVVEGGESVQYGININGMEIPIDVEVRRNGVLIYCRNRGGLTGQPVTPFVTRPEPPREVVREVTVREVVLVLCPHCNHRNDAARRTCENCGASI